MARQSEEMVREDKKDLQGKNPSAGNDELQYIGILILLIVVAYCAYLPMHYGNDTWFALKNSQSLDAMQEGYVQAVMGEAVYSCFSAGRYTRGLLFLAFALPGYASLLVKPWVNVVAIVFLCLSGITLWKIVRSCCNEESCGSVCRSILFLCCCIAVVNPFFTDWLQFSEVNLYYPLGLYLSLAAGKVILDSSKSSWKRFLESFILLAAAGGLYQIVMFYYAAVVVMLLGRNVKSGCFRPKRFFLQAFYSGMVYVFAAAVQLLFTRVLFQSERITSYRAGEIWESMLQAQKNLYRMAPYTGNCLSVLYTVLLIALLLQGILRIACCKDHVLVRLVLYVLRFAAVYVLLFVPFVVSLWFSQRTLVGFWMLPLVAAVMNQENEMRWAVCCEKYVLRTAAAIGAVLLLVNVWNCLQFGVDMYKVYGMDTARAYMMLEKIEEYEEESGQVVMEVAFYQPENKKYYYDGIFGYCENNQVRWTASWNQLPILEVVGNRDFTQVEYPEELLTEQGTGQKEKDSIYFEGNTAYIILY